MSALMTPSLATMQLEDRSGECVCPPEVLFDILDCLPARSLLTMRAVSHHFQQAVDSLIRSRFLAIINDPAHEMVFESSSPANYRTSHRQLLKFSRFLEREKVVNSDIAAFLLPASPAVPHFVPLDEDELFGSHLLSVHIRGIEIPEPLAPSPAPSAANFTAATSYEYESQTRPLGVSAVGIPPPRAGRSSASSSPASSISPATSSPSTAFTSPSSTPPQRRKVPQFSFSLTLAEGLDRLYRDWFESDPYTVLTYSRKTATHVLSPGGGTGLVAAQIACCQVPRLIPTVGAAGSVYSPFSSSYGSGAYTPGVHKSFEFSYERVDLDVGKILVCVEEGLDKGGCRGEVVLWMSL